MSDQTKTDFSATIDGLDISQLSTDIRLYEDIFSNFCTASIVVVDTRGILFSKPIFGEEQVKIKLTNLTGTIEKDLVVFKISDVSTPKQNVWQYTLHLCSKELIINVATKVAKAFSNQKASDAVRSLLTSQYPYGLGYSGPMTIEESAYSDSFISTYWTPFEAINWLCGRSVTAANPDAANFVFYETLKSGFKFVSLETLIAASPVVEITTYREGLNSRQIRQNNAREFQISKHNNLLSNIENGLYAGTLVTHDVATKEIKVYEYQYRSDFPHVKSLEAAPFIRGNSVLDGMSLSTRSQFETHTGIFDGSTETGFKPDKFLLQRKSQLTAINAMRLSVQLGGNLGFEVGQTVSLVLMTPTGAEQTEKNPWYSGKYLITALKHVFINGEIHTILELGRDSLPATLP